LKVFWTTALSKGVCPYAGCDLSATTCKHLDRYLDYGSKFVQPSVQFTGQPEEFPDPEDPPAAAGIWEKFKALRKYPLRQDQILLILLKDHMKMSRADIIRHMGWTSNSSVDSRYKTAIATLRRKFRGKA
jgi:hypothetical protein